MFLIMTAAKFFWKLNFHLGAPAKNLNLTKMNYFCKALVRFEFLGNQAFIRGAGAKLHTARVSEQNLVRLGCKVNIKTKFLGMMSRHCFIGATWCLKQALRFKKFWALHFRDSCTIKINIKKQMFLNLVFIRFLILCQKSPVKPIKAN